MYQTGTIICPFSVMLRQKTNILHTKSNYLAGPTFTKKSFQYKHKLSLSLVFFIYLITTKHIEVQFKTFEEDRQTHSLRQTDGHRQTDTDRNLQTDGHMNIDKLL